MINDLQTRKNDLMREISDRRMDPFLRIIMEYIEVLKEECVEKMMNETDDTKITLLLGQSRGYHYLLKSLLKEVPKHIDLKR